MRWEWFTDIAFDPRPYWFERQCLRRGRPRAARPRIRQDAVRYAFDDDSRIVQVQEFSGFLRGRLVSEERWEYGDGTIVRTRVNADGARLFVHRCLLDGGLLTRFEAETGGGSSTEDYTYVEGRPVRVDISHGGRPFSTARFAYDADGNLGQIETTYLQGRRFSEITYRRPAPGITLDDLRNTVVDALVDRVPSIVAAANIDRTAFCVALAYGDTSCGPTVGVGLEEERREWRANDEGVWNPADFEFADVSSDEFDEAEIAEAVRMLDQEMTLGEPSFGIRDVLIAVARRLNRFDWSSILSVTPDFVVYPVDYELVELRRNLRDSVR